MFGTCFLRRTGRNQKRDNSILTIKPKGKRICLKTHQYKFYDVLSKWLFLFRLGVGTNFFSVFVVKMRSKLTPKRLKIRSENGRENGRQKRVQKGRF